MSVASSSLYTKKWDAIFSKEREFKEKWSRSYLDKKREIDAAGDGIELFYRDSDGSIPDCKVEELEDFAAGVSLEDLKCGAGSAGQRHGAWLDERSITSEPREHKNPLTAAQLYERLKSRRIGNEHAPDADRRLVYIEKFDPFYMLALVETATFHEVPSLRDALWKHIARQTSLKVRIPTKGYKIFQLGFHLKYFVFRPWPSVDETDKNSTASNPPSQWTNLSFLEIQTPKALDGTKYGMFEAHFSFVICGSQENRWVAYAVDETEFDGEELYDKIFPCEGVHADPIASDDDTDAERPIWNCREYFLKCVESRMSRAATEWEALVRRVHRSIIEYRKRNPSTLSHLDGSKKDRSETAKKAFDWTRKTKELLSQLREPLSAAIKFWERFNSSDGDVGYFSDVNSSDDSPNRMNLSIRAINETFETLEELQQTLNTLMKDCEDYANALQLRLTLESSEATKSSGATTDFTLFIFGPIALAAACLQLSPAVMPLPPSPKSLAILTLVFVVTIKLLHAISSVIPGISWWWRTVKAPVKAMKIEGLGNSLSVFPLSRPVRKQRGHMDRKAPDVEMAPVP